MQSYTKSSLRAAAVAVAFLGLSVISWAEPKDCPRTSKDVPFFGAFIGNPTVDVDLTTGIQGVHFLGVGVGCGLDDVLCASDDEKAYPYPVVDGSKGTVSSGTLTRMTGTYTIYGDDGDSIVIWISTPPERYFFNEVTGHLDFSGTFTVIPGGTGRYRDATGSGTFAGSADAHPETGIPVNGHLTLVGQGRWALWGTLSGVKTGHRSH